MFDVTHVRSLGDKKVVRYNEDGAPIGENEAKLANNEIHHAHKDEPQLLQVPPKKYSFIEQNHWEEFIGSRLSETFQEKRQLQKDRRSKNKYNLRISRKGGEHQAVGVGFFFLQTSFHSP
uniref:Uncharacterized protein n=1 Tax=Cucumis melo TaxID=3656 RepID=A0A9I9E512_CUCME